MNFFKIYCHDQSDKNPNKIYRAYLGEIGIVPGSCARYYCRGCGVVWQFSVGEDGEIMRRPVARDDNAEHVERTVVTSEGGDTSNLTLTPDLVECRGAKDRKSLSQFSSGAV